MSEALYRKYRPASFDELVDQNPIKVTLKNELENDRVSHAYLFAGPRGVGKTTTARLLAMAVNTKSLKGDEKKRVEKDILAGKSIDVIEIDAASHTGVDNVRENIIESSRFTPQQLPYKVYIIDEVHMLSTSAFNALLKTLEEPPAHVIFILATTEIHRVPETIISRCQRFDFKRVTVTDLVLRLQFLAKQEGVSVEEELLKNIARRAEGSVRDAEVLLGQILSLGGKKITEEQASLVLPRSNIGLLVEFFGTLVHQDQSAAIGLINRLVEEGVHLQDFTKDFIEFLRRILLLKVSGSAGELSQFDLDDETLKEVTNQAETLSLRKAQHMVEAFMKAMQNIRSATIPQLPLELAVLEVTSDESPSTTPHNPPSVPPTATAPLQPTTKSAPPSPTRKYTAPTTVDETPTKKKKLVKKGNLTLAAVRESWNDIVDAIGKDNRSVGMSLKVAIPTALEGDHLVISFQHAFHAERLGNPSVKAVIQEALKEMLGAAIKFSTAVISAEEFAKLNPIELKTNESGAAIKQAMEVFGGEIVEEEN